MHPLHGPSPEHTIWLRDHQAAFVYLPKVACTSWKLFLGEALGLTRETITYANVHNGAALPLPYLSNESSKEQQRFYTEVGNGTIKLFSVLREPRERALSAYLDKIQLHNNPNSYFSQTVLPEIQEFHGLSTGAIPDFAQFLEWIQANRSSHCSNDHWKPMCQLLGLTLNSNGSSTTAADLPGHWHLWTMPQMPEAAATIGKLLSYSGNFPSREVLGERPNRNSSKHLNDHLTDAVDQLLRQIYEQDLLLYKAVLQSQEKP